MIITDRIYGKVEIEEKVINELLISKPVVRLKKINQAGPSFYLYNWKNITRFEHSAGVMLLLRRFNASLNSQIAGLLHDVPHTAFSHVADFVFANEKHEFHELFHEKMIKDSEIPQILTKYQIPETVIHPEKFSLLEKNIPDICADRIDYALRDVFAFDNDRKRLNLKLSGIIVKNEEFMFSSIEAAHIFAKDYLEMDERAWASPREIALYVLMAQAISHALERKIISRSDLFKDDFTVIQLLKEKGDQYIAKKLAFLTPSFRIESASKNHHHLFVKAKVRFVDPKISIENQIVRLSQVVPGYKSLMEKHIEKAKKGWYVYAYKE